MGKVIEISVWQDPYSAGYSDGYGFVGDNYCFLKGSIRYDLYQGGLLDGLADAIHDKALRVKK